MQVSIQTISNFFTKQNRILISAAVLLLIGLPVSVSLNSEQQNLQSNAAGMSSIEPENGTLAGNVTVVNDAAASGGKYVVLGTIVPPTPVPLSCTMGGATGSTASQVFPVNAIPNDATDDTNAIQTAINNASSAGGGVVTLSAGTYLTNKHLLLKSNVKLQGLGSQTVIKAGTSFMNTAGPFGGYPLITSNGASNVTIANLTADQSGDTLNGNVGTRLTEYLIDIRYTTNAVVDGVSTRNPFTYSIAVVESTKFCVKNSNTLVATNGKYNQLDGIHILNSSFGDVISNTVDQRVGADGDDGLVAHTINGSVHDVTYAGNKVRGGSHGAAMQFAYTASTDQIYNILVQSNEFWGSPRGMWTGTYGTPGTSHHVTIGGDSAKGNYFHDNSGNAVDFTGSLSYIIVTHNRACNSGIFSVGAGTGNVVTNNTTSC